MKLHCSLFMLSCTTTLKDTLLICDVNQKPDIPPSKYPRTNHQKKKQKTNAPTTQPLFIASERVSDQD